MGTHVWPEINFLVISYIDDAIAEKVKEEIQKIKEQFPDEGIKLFMVEAG
jgi:hypothetical protein